MKKPIEKIKITPDLLAYYSRVGDFLKRNPEIKSKKLPRIGFEVDVSTIPKHLVNEWISIVKNE